MRIAVIAAVADNRVIGIRGRLPWHIPEDLARFRRLTMGRHLLMGRRTYESLERPLDGRTCLVVSSRPVSGAAAFPDVASALSSLPPDAQLFIAGGTSLFAAFLERADHLHLTRVHAEPAGDAFFPPFEHLLGARYRLAAREPHTGFTFEEWAAVP